MDEVNGMYISHPHSDGHGSINAYINKQKAIEAIVSHTNCKTEEELLEYVKIHNLEFGWSGGVLEGIKAIMEVPEEIYHVCAGESDD